MLESIYGWIRNIAFYLVMVTVLFHMLPDTDYKKYIRFFTGLILILLLTEPVLKLLDIDYWVTDLYESEEYQRQIQRMEEAAPFLNEVDDAGAEENSEEPKENEKRVIEVEEIQIER